MALIKFINGKNKKTAGLSRAIDYVVDKNKIGKFFFEGIDERDIPKNEIDNEMLFVEKLIGDENNKGDRAINYITKDSKTNLNLVSGFNCRPFVHFIQSFHPKEDMTPELAHKIGLELLEDERFKDFQIVIATHIDRDHIHNHFILNTVNMETGKKWQQSNMELEKLKKYSNQLCYKHGLQHSITSTKTNEFTNKKFMFSGEYRASPTFG